MDIFMVILLKVSNCGPQDESEVCELLIEDWLFLHCIIQELFQKFWCQFRRQCFMNKKSSVKCEW